MPKDMYGRDVTLETSEGTDIYTVDDGQGNIFSVEVFAGKSQDAVYTTINAMAPFQTEIQPEE